MKKRKAVIMETKTGIADIRLIGLDGETKTYPSTSMIFATRSDFPVGLST